MDLNIETLKHIEQKVEDFNTNLQLIVSAIRGNELTQTGGMVRDIAETKVEIKEIKDRLTSLENFRNKWNWTATIIVATSGFLGTAIGLLLAYLNFSKH